MDPLIHPRKLQLKLMGAIALLCAVSSASGVNFTVAFPDGSKQVLTSSVNGHPDYMRKDSSDTCFLYNEIYPLVLREFSTDPTRPNKWHEFDWAGVTACHQLLYDVSNGNQGGTLTAIANEGAALKWSVQLNCTESAAITKLTDYINSAIGKPQAHTIVQGGVTKYIISTYWHPKISAAGWTNVRNAVRSNTGKELYIVGDYGPWVLTTRTDWDAYKNTADSWYTFPEPLNSSQIDGIATTMNGLSKPYGGGIFAATAREDIANGGYRDADGTKHFRDWWQLHSLDRTVKWQTTNTWNDTYEKHHIMPSSDQSWTRADLNLWYNYKLRGVAPSTRWGDNAMLYITTPQHLHLSEASVAEALVLNASSRTVTAKVQLLDNAGSLIGSPVQVSVPANSLGAARITLNYAAQPTAGFIRARGWMIDGATTKTVDSAPVCIYPNGYSTDLKLVYYSIAEAYKLTTRPTITLSGSTASVGNVAASPRFVEVLQNTRSVKNMFNHSPYNCSFPLDPAKICRNKSTQWNITNSSYKINGYYFARVIDSNEKVSYSDPVWYGTSPPPQGPAAPSGLTATAVSASQINLSWTDNSSNETGFKIQRKTGAGGTYAQIATVGANVVTYNNTDLAAGTTYYYQVASYNGAGSSGWSNEANATTQGGSPPPVPTGLTASPGDNQVALSWTASTGATSYNVKRATVSGGPYSTIASPTGTSHTDATAVNGTTYYYVVSAVNGNGESANSTQVSATPQPPPPPTPTDLTATPGDNQVALSWTASSGATSYNVKRATVSGGPYSTIASPTGTSHTDTTAVNGTTYYYVVSAVNGGGESANSAQVSATPVAGGAWTDTDIGTVGLAGSGTENAGTFTVSGAGSDIGSTADSFNFMHGSMTGDGTITARIATQTIGGTVNDKIGLMMRESTATGSIMVMVVLDNGLGKSRVVSRSTTGGAAAWVEGPTGITLPRWYKLVRAGNTFTGSVSTDGSTWTTVGSVTVTMTSSVRVGFAVCSRNTDALNTSTFDNVTSPVGGGSPPPVPTGLTATPGDNQVALSWTASTGATSYNVKRATVSGGPYSTIASPTGTSYTDTTAVNGTTYYYVVSAVSGGGESANSTQVSATPLPWTDTDIGTVGLAGSGTVSGGVFTVSGAGSDIGSTADSFNFMHESMTGNGTITARIASQTIGGAVNDKIGLMMRESTATGSIMVMVVLDNGLGKSRVVSRSTTGGSAAWVEGPTGITLPRWYRLQRSSNTFTGSVSTDGSTWTTVGSVTVTMTSSVRVGFAVCSRNTDALNTSTFDNVTAP